MSNSENPQKGVDFQLKVREWFENNRGQGFELEKEIFIGNNGKKAHRFDIVNLNKRIVIECKRYTWTGTGNIPSAKIATLNEAAFYLSFLSKKYEKYIVMFKDYNHNKKESLAKHYYRRYYYLLRDIIVAEFDTETNKLIPIEL